MSTEGRTPWDWATTAPGGKPMECEEPVMPEGTWQTTSGGGVAAVVIGVVAVAGALAYVALRSMAVMLGDAAAIAVTAVIAVSLGAGVTLLAVRVRQRRKAKPSAVPAIAEAFAREHEIRAARSRPAIAPPQVSNTYNFFGAGSEAIAARLMAQQQPAPATVRAEVER